MEIEAVSYKYLSYQYWISQYFETTDFGIVTKGWVKKNELALTDSSLYLWKEQLKLKKYDPPPKNGKLSGSYFFNYFEFLLLPEI